MDIRFTNHVQYRLLERGIDTDKIKRAINADTKPSRIEPNLLVARWNIDEKTLEVIYKIEGKRRIIITAYHI